MKKNQLRNIGNKGVSLIELIIYIAISAILLVEISGILSQVVYNQTKVSAIAREDETARSLLHIISQNVQEINTLTTPDAVNASGSTLTFVDYNNNTISYSISNGIVYKQVNSNAQVAISPNDVYVTNLTFTVESEAGVAPSINIKLDIQQSQTNSSNTTHYETTAAERKI